MKYNNILKALPKVIGDLNKVSTHHAADRVIVGQAVGYLVVLADLINEINHSTEQDELSISIIASMITSDSRCQLGDWVPQEVLGEYIKYRTNHPTGNWREQYENAFHATAHE
jgi:hypothetical protein